MDCLRRAELCINAGQVLDFCFRSASLSKPDAIICVGDIRTRHDTRKGQWSVGGQGARPLGRGEGQGLARLGPSAMSAIWSRSGVKRTRAREAVRRVKLRQHRFWIDTGPGLAPEFGSGSIHPPPAPFGDGERINSIRPSPLANGSARQAPIFSVRR